MKNKLWIALLVACFWASAMAQTEAQLFGNRELGRTLRQRPSPAEEVGQVDSADRFLRGNRAANDFVGSDAGESGVFVGQQQGTTRGRVRSAAESLRPAKEKNVNRRRNNARSGKTRLYRPRLSIGFTYAGPQPSSISKTLVERILRLEGLGSPGLVEVRIRDRTAILEGEVPSSRLRILAEQLARLEPGIVQVQNDLRVTDAPPEPGLSVP